MSIDLEEIRSHSPIETIVGEHFPLRKSGSRFVGVEHDSPQQWDVFLELQRGA